MANNYSNCEKKYDRQLAAAFAVYMMAGSAFKKCICRNPLEEGHLCLHYREMPERLQLEAENGVEAMELLRQREVHPRLRREHGIARSHN